MLIKCYDDELYVRRILSQHNLVFINVPNIGKYLYHGDGSVETQWGTDEESMIDNIEELISYIKRWSFHFCYEIKDRSTRYVE